MGTAEEVHNTTLTQGDLARAHTVAQSSTGVDATMAADALYDSNGQLIASPRVTRGSSCVLPRLEGNADSPSLVHDERQRYTPISVLGSGGMGEVTLAEDLDIGRKVALKNLRADMKSAPSLARFVEEIRTIGRLEHPNIVPIHDVGVNASGDYFFVMKHVDGETLESIIEKLAAGDPAYHAKYSVERRLDMVMGILRALQFAHDAGIVHRDIKPANVMVGRYGEVVLMDWGIAKMIGDTRKDTREETKEPEGERARLFTTRHGQLVGTPAYMSPEQARGDIAAIDARSDLYSVTVLLHELLTLRHYLHDKQAVPAMLAAIIAEPPAFGILFGSSSPHQPPPPPELGHILRKGLQKDKEQRFQSAAEFLQRIECVLSGNFAVQCPATMAKRMTRESGRMVDRHPILGMLGLFFATIMAFVGIAQTIRMFVR